MFNSLAVDISLSCSAVQQRKAKLGEQDFPATHICTKSNVQVTVCKRLTRMIPFSARDYTQIEGG